MNKEAISEKDLSLLFEKISKGDTDSFTILFNQFYSRIYSTALQYCKTKHLAEDVAQQVFTILWEKRNELPSVNNGEAWLWTVTRNQTLKILKKESTNPSYIAYVKDFFQSETDTPLSQLIIRQKSERIEKIISGLSLRQQEVYRLSRYQGASYAEIAALLGIGPETVKEHMAKALRNIRQLLIAYKHELLFFVTALNL